MCWAKTRYPTSLACKEKKAKKKKKQQCTLKIAKYFEMSLQKSLKFNKILNKDFFIKTKFK